MRNDPLNLHTYDVVPQMTLKYFVVTQTPYKMAKIPKQVT